MSWRRWKMGLVVALLSGLFDAGVVVFVDPKIALKALLFAVLLLACKAGGLFLKQHPFEEVTSDTTIVPNPGAPQRLTPPGTFGLAIALGCLVLLAVGCGTIDRIATAVTRPVTTVTAQTNTVVEAQVSAATNYVADGVRVEGAVTVTNYVPTIVLLTNQVPVTRVELVTNTVYVAKESITGAIHTGETVSGFIPPPYGTAATAALGAVSGALGLLVSRKNKENANLAQQVTAVVAGVENAVRVIDPAAGEKVKKIIADTSKELGVSDDLHATVKALTV